MSLKDFIAAREANEVDSWKQPQPPNWIKVEEPSNPADEEAFSPEVEAIQDRLLSKIREKYDDFDTWNKSFGYSLEFIIQWSYHMMTELSEAADKDNYLPAIEGRSYFKQVYDGAIYLVEERLACDQEDCRKYGDFSKINSLIERDIKEFDDKVYTCWLLTDAFTYKLEEAMDYGIETAQSEKGIFNRKEKNEEIENLQEIKSMIIELRELMETAIRALTPDTSEYE